MCQKDNEIVELKKTIAKLDLMLDSIKQNYKRDVNADLKARRMAQFAVKAYQFLFKDPTNDKAYEELKILSKGLHEFL